MTFNFHEQYKDFSTVELLKIVKRPSQYQVEAVRAAAEILMSRKISITELEEVDHYFYELDAEAKRKTDKINSFKERTADFLQPVIHPTKEVVPQQWLNIFLLVIVIQYLWALYNGIRRFIHFIQYLIDCKTYGFEESSSDVSYWTCFTANFDPFAIFEFAEIIYIPIVFFLLFRKKRWGWILVFANSLAGFILLLSQSYIFFNFQQFHGGNTASFLTQIIMKAMLVFFLWRKNIAEFFGVSKEIKRKTVVITLVVVFLFIFLLEVFG